MQVAVYPVVDDVGLAVVLVLWFVVLIGHVP